MADHKFTSQEVRNHVTTVRRLRRLLDQEHEMGLAIMAIPSSPIRDLLTEANIHLMSACSKLRETEEALRKQITT